MTKNFKKSLEKHTLSSSILLLDYISSTEHPKHSPPPDLPLQNSSPYLTPSLSGFHYPGIFAHPSVSIFYRIRQIFINLGRTRQSSAKYVQGSLVQPVYTFCLVAKSLTAFMGPS